MITVTPSAAIESPVDGFAILKRIERAGRTCYKSEDKITEDSAIAFVRKISHQLKHHSVLEHESVTVRFICDRGVSHEIVRHRIASYSQESTRYCNYSKDKFGGDVAFIIPPGLTADAESAWRSAMLDAEAAYNTMLSEGCSPQIARSVLPNSLKTELVMTANLREWMHFFTLRCSAAAHPQMRQLAVPLLAKFQEAIPVVFDEIPCVPLNPDTEAAR